MKKQIPQPPATPTSAPSRCPQGDDAPSLEKAFEKSAWSEDGRKALAQFGATMRRIGGTMNRIADAINKALRPIERERPLISPAVASAAREFQQRQEQELDSYRIKKVGPAGDFEALAAWCNAKRRLKRKADETAWAYCRRWLMKTNPSWNGHKMPYELFVKPGNPARGITAEEVAEIDRWRDGGSAWKTIHFMHGYGSPEARAKYRAYDAWNKSPKNKA
jgi:hypothetical protein